MYPIMSVNMASSGSAHKHCCVPQCLNDPRTTLGIHFYRLLENKTIRKAWIVKIGRDLRPFSNFPPVSYAANVMINSPLRHFSRVNFRSANIITSDVMSISYVIIKGREINELTING